jgi:hypothetical protein
MSYPKSARMKLRSVWLLFACVITTWPFVGVKYIVPAPTSAAALAVVGTAIVAVFAEMRGSWMVVLDTPLVSVAVVVQSTPPTPMRLMALASNTACCAVLLVWIGTGWKGFVDCDTPEMKSVGAKPVMVIVPAPGDTVTGLDIRDAYGVCVAVNSPLAFHAIVNVLTSIEIVPPPVFSATYPTSRSVLAMDAPARLATTA